MKLQHAVTGARSPYFKALLTGADGFGNHLNFIYSPLSGELSLASEYPDGAATIANTPHYAQHLHELRSAVAPELEPIESRVVGPVKEFQGVLKVIRKMITKRGPKLVDYDRFNNSLTKLRDKKEKGLSEEKNLTGAGSTIHDNAHTGCAPKRAAVKTDSWKDHRFSERRPRHRPGSASSEACREARSLGQVRLGALSKPRLNSP